MSCNILRLFAMCCYVLQCVAVCCSVPYDAELQHTGDGMQWFVATCFSVLHCVAECCVVQHDIYIYICIYIYI